MALPSECFFYLIPLMRVGKEKTEPEISLFEVPLFGKSGGHRLGLFYTKKWLAQVGGRLEIKSSQGNDAQVTIIIPVSSKVGLRI
jgi:signal transduction histidine kinase